MKTVQTTLKRDWSSYNQYQIHEKPLFLKILNDSVKMLNIPEEKPRDGRPSLGMDGMIRCSLIKVYNCFSSRRTISDLYLSRVLGYIPKVPHFNSISNYMMKPEMTGYLDTLYKILATPFIGIEDYFAIDSTGFGQYNTSWLKARKNRKEWKSFNKLHIITGVKSNVIVKAEVTEAKVHDVLKFPSMLRETCKRFNVKEITGDKGYLALYNVNEAIKCGAVPYIMPKSNTKLYRKKPWIYGEGWDKMILLFRHKEDFFRKHYHRRSNVESSFSSLKRKFLPYVRSKDPIAQRNEILCKVCCHNISMLIRGIFMLGVTAEFSDVPR